MEQLQPETNIVQFPKKKIKVVQLIFIVLFALIVCAFPVLWIFGATAGRNYENNVLAEAPKFQDMFLNYSTFSQEFEDYYNDTFPYKSTLISLYSLMQYKVFNSSILPKVTSLGKNGWLFYEDYGTRSSVNGERMLTNSELEYIYNGIVTKYNKLKSLGKEYVVYIAPEKQTIYSEYDNNHTADYTMIDQLVDYLAEKECPATVIYGKEFLLANKTNQIYFKYDTHWNQLGSHYGYLDVMNKVKTLLPDMDINVATTFETGYYKYSGDLAGTLFLSDYLDENAPDVRYQYTPTYSILNDIVTVVDSNVESDLQVMIYGDSFAQASYWSENFAQSASQTRIMHNRNTFQALLDNLGDSDVVIEECVQRVPTTLGNCTFDE